MAARPYDGVDVERYPEFVPLCHKHAIESHETLGGAETLMTDMTIAYRIFRETFCCAFLFYSLLTATFATLLAAMIHLTYPSP
jgi:ribosome-associated toxin RatA of RatAB toxin-antitoxin module